MLHAGRTRKPSFPEIAPTTEYTVARVAPGRWSRSVFARLERTAGSGLRPVTTKLNSLQNQRWVLSPSGGQLSSYPATLQWTLFQIKTRSSQTEPPRVN